MVTKEKNVVEYGSVLQPLAHQLLEERKLQLVITASYREAQLGQCPAKSTPSSCSGLLPLQHGFLQNVVGMKSHTLQFFSVFSYFITMFETQPHLCSCQHPFLFQRLLVQSHYVGSEHHILLSQGLLVPRFHRKYGEKRQGYGHGRFCKCEGVSKCQRLYGSQRPHRYRHLLIPEQQMKC